MASLQTAAQALAAALSGPRGELEAPAGLRLCPVVGPANSLSPRLPHPRTDRTARLAGVIKAYNPDPEWKLVTAAGMVAAVSEK